ncbi:MAG: hypothetical protein NC241_05120 [Bacteroides sp.]|nr:hypothetical protein [Bacteroides sp.]MCM1457392.1 hypothetical protein [Lachnoclostridium sp.]
MKHIIILCAALAMVSCTTTEKFTLNVPRNATVICPSPQNKVLGVAHNSGNVKIECPSEWYLGYVYVQQEGSDTKIPMGIDFERCNHTGTKIARGAGYALTGIGTGAVIIGTVVGALGTETGWVIAGGGLALDAIGLGVGWPADGRISQTAYDYNFKYSKYQNIDIPTLSPTLLHPNPSREDKGKKEESGQTLRKKTTSGKNSESATVSKVSKSRTDYGKRIEGVYEGSGSLKLNGRSEEIYDEIIVKIKRIDKNHVLVSVIEGEEEYFDAPLRYTIKNTSKGYKLTIEKMPNATISISKKGELKFEHKDVYIEDRKYALLISAQKQKD